MEIYLVGGAVRDKLLDLPIKERDWVVVGATPEMLIAEGFRPVGKDFPVFLHPKTKEEYALARTERKSGKGYTGFVFYAAPDVTLEQDLQRRDLTINAIAESADGILIDPFHGQEDLKNKTLRHVSPAFAEDPVRILRVARFAARFSEFEIDPATMQLMRQMVKDGEADALVPERVWKETETALNETNPERFFQILNECCALKILFPLLENKLADALNALKKAASLTPITEIRFAALLHKNSEEEIKSLCQDLRVPRKYQDLAIHLVRHQTDYQQALTLTAEQILNMFEKTDAFRRPHRLEELLIACEASSSTALVREKTKYLQTTFIAAQQINTKEFADSDLTGKEISEVIHKKRKQAVAAIIKSHLR